MTNTLISFLGKASKDTGGRYRTVNYDFDGTSKTTQFFGLGLSEIIEPEKLVILGTSGSMWDVFYENFSHSYEQGEHWLILADAVENDAVTQSILDTCQVEVSKQLGRNCQLKLIPYGINQNEQVEILKIIASDIQPCDKVSLDLSHGLRHLPMLGLLSAMYLQTARRVQIDGIYYGALDRTKDNITPVIRLDGLLKITDWITALHGFDKTGDIAPFSLLLQNEGVPKATSGLLQEAAFQESILKISNARRPLREFSAKTTEGLPGIASLFQDSLNERISWKDKNNLYQRQRERTLFHLKRGDYVRSVLLGFEALITREIQAKSQRSQPEVYETRQQAKRDLDTFIDIVRKDSYIQLKAIRNTLAHSDAAVTADVQRALANEGNLQNTLAELFSVLLPETL